MSDQGVQAGAGSAPRISIVVAVRNGAGTIAACVTSLLGQTHPSEDLEILVVDNRSTDSTRDILRSFGSRIRVLEEDTLGSAAARNRGIRAARGQYVAFTDADCVVEPEWIAAITTPLDDPTIGVVGGKVLSRTDGNAIERFGEWIHDHRRAIEEESPPYAVAGNWASRLDVLRECGGFDETFLRSQDVDLAWRLHRLGYRIVYAADAVVRHDNERTLRGLLHEGYLHGLHGVRLRTVHADLLPPPKPRARAARARLASAMRRLISSPRSTDAWMGLVFDLGKVAGELAARR